MWEGRQRKITRHCVPLSGGVVPGLKGQLLPWTGRGFLSLFSYVAGLLFRGIGAMIELTIWDLRIVALAQWLGWFRAEDTEQRLGERSTFV